jgi:hypothetical protein
VEAIFKNEIKNNLKPLLYTKMNYFDEVDLRKLEWVVENADKVNLGKSYVKGHLISGDGQLDILKKYFKRAIHFDGNIPVSYFQHDNDGRRFSHEISLTNLARPIRHTIAKGMIDIDIKNAHPCILLWLCERNGIECHFIKKYVDNREPMLQELVHGRQLSRDGAKKMLLKAINRDDARFQQTENDPEWLYDYHQQCKKIAETLCKLYPDYMTQAEKSKKRKDQDAWNMKGSAMNRLLCHHENELLKLIEEVVISNNGTVRNLAYDGCMIVDSFSEPELQELFQDIAKRVQQEYPTLNFVMEKKEMKEGFIVPDSFITKKEKKIRTFTEKEKKRIQKQIEREWKEDDDTEEYEEWKENWEKKHCKIMEPVSILLTNSKDEFDFSDLVNLQQKYSHFGHKFVNFIGRWWYDTTMRVYSRADIFAPRQDCPKDVFNLWQQYPLEGREVVETPELKEKVDKLLGHFMIMSGHDEKVYEYLLDWNAQFLQYPHIKTTMPVITSTEGSGKDSFLTIQKKMLGSNLVFETSRPEDVFGRFNSILANARLIVLNEMSATDLRQYDKDMKMVITDGELSLEGKGKVIYRLKSMHRLVLFNNSTNNPVQTTKGDRRKLIVRASDEKIGDGAYFNDLHSCIEDLDAMALLFQFFMKRDVLKFNNERGRDIPKTEFQLDIIESYANPVELWIKELINYRYLPKTTEEYKETIEWYAAEQLNSFRAWCSNNGIKLELSSPQLGIRIKNLKIDGIENVHTKTGAKRVFHLEKIETYFTPRKQMTETTKRDG